MGWGSAIGGTTGTVVGSIIAPGVGTAIGGSAGTLLGQGTEALIRGGSGANKAPTRGQYQTADRRMVRLRGGAVLSYQQVQMMSVIQDVVMRTRLPHPLGAPAAKYALTMAMVANAIAESNLDPTAAGDGGLSIGLFQAHTKAGAGRGHPIQALQNPRYNTMVILGELVDQLPAFRTALRVGTDAVELTRMFSRLVERPRDVEGEQDRRERIVRQVFGDLVDEPVRV